MPLIGYARVSTEDQTPLPQIQALNAAGCGQILEEQASGGDRARPVLARLLEQIRKGDTLVVVRIDRLAGSLSHLLEVIERLEAKGAFFRSIEDPIDTASPQGKFTLQVLGAAAEFERALIRERTKAGLASARSEGRIGGNPGLRARDRAALRKVRLARHEGFLERLSGTAQEWVPQVRRLRPDMAWEDVLRLINAPCPPRANGRRRASPGQPVPMYVTASCPKPCWGAPSVGSAMTVCRLSLRRSEAPTPTSLCRRSATGWRQCANAPRAGGRHGSPHPSGCCLAKPTSWACWRNRHSSRHNSIW